ncbi:MAG: phosphoadenylyl-sulfate reductase [Rhodospirillales bacterium]|nr:phosphoadenylyl-sulfate reductase [Rhodospirillales bacterium]
MSNLAHTIPTPSAYSDVDLLAPYIRLQGEDLLKEMIGTVFPGRITVSSSIGAESAVLLDMVARIDPSTPVIFLDTGMLFRETLEYKDLLQQRLGLTDIRVVRPDGDELRRIDPEQRLHETNHDACCRLRKVNPLRQALHGFDAWITGRKRFHGGQRSTLPILENDDGRLKINPLAGWSQAQIDQAFDQRGLPRHPLVFEGYLSLGCEPCTQKFTCKENIRAGRWAGSGKSECGIHTQSLFRQDKS